MLETEARTLLGRYGVNFVPAKFCTTAADAKAAATHRLNALKVVAPSVLHKTDAGGVVLDVPPGDAGFVFNRLMAVAPDAQGVLVSPMLDQPLAEVLVGARRDPHFGPVLTVGPGGVYVELLHDLAIRLLPIDRAEAARMIDETQLGWLLAGARGRARADREALITMMLQVGECLLANEAVLDVELNPVFVYERGACAIDARAIMPEDAW